MDMKSISCDPNRPETPHGPDQLNTESDLTRRHRVETSAHFKVNSVSGYYVRGASCSANSTTHSSLDPARPAASQPTNSPDAVLRCFYSKPDRASARPIS